MLKNGKDIKKTFEIIQKTHFPVYAQQFASHGRS
jgi:hypothetical protein